jgi:hypothetical protein
MRRADSGFALGIFLATEERKDSRVNELPDFFVLTIFDTTLVSVADLVVFLAVVFFFIKKNLL